MPRLAPSARTVSIDMPSQLVPNFDHFVTQWMSVVSRVRGRALNSSQLHCAVLPSTLRSVKLHFVRGVRGVGPAERTGKSFVSYWPGGRRRGSESGGRRPRNPREIIAGFSREIVPERGIVPFQVLPPSIDNNA